MQPPLTCVKAKLKFYLMLNHQVQFLWSICNCKLQKEI